MKQRQTTDKKAAVGLADSFGAWTMTDREEEEIFSGLKMNWKKTTIAIRKRARIREQYDCSD